MSQDGALFGWSYQKPGAGGRAAGRGGDGSEGGGGESGSESGGGSDGGEAAEPAFAGGAWQVAFKHYFLQRGAKLSCADLHRRARGGGRCCLRAGGGGADARAGSPVARRSGGAL